VKFQQNESGGTTLHVQFVYNPPAGVIGHVFASPFGADPKHALDDDMARLKSLFEVGKTTVHGHRITRDEVERRSSLPKNRVELLGRREDPAGTKYCLSGATSRKPALDQEMSIGPDAFSPQRPSCRIHIELVRAKA
jgi:hypothetical protein